MATKVFFVGDDPHTVAGLGAELDNLFSEGYEVKIDNSKLVVLYKPDVSNDAMDLNLARVRDYLGLPDIRDENGRPLPINDLLERIKANVNAPKSILDSDFMREFDEKHQWDVDLNK